MTGRRFVAWLCRRLPPCTCRECVCYEFEWLELEWGCPRHDPRNLDLRLAERIADPIVTRVLA